jgi:uncharacterized membrane protein SirB2
VLAHRLTRILPHLVDSRLEVLCCWPGSVANFSARLADGKIFRLACHIVPGALALKKLARAGREQFSFAIVAYAHRQRCRSRNPWP